MRQLMSGFRQGGRYAVIEKLFKFGIVGVTGTLINTAALYVLTLFGMHYLIAAAIATEIAIITNFIGNHYFTFKHVNDTASIRKRFLTFQGISLFTLIGTLTILWALTTTFGIKYLLVWNLLAILAMFLANFALNARFTWKGAARATAILFAFALVANGASADVATISELGYHPLSHKQVVVYTGDASGTFELKDKDTHVTVFNGTLVKAKDFTENDVNCQGNLSCLVGDFSTYNETGTYYILTNTALQTPNFRINPAIFSDTVVIFDEFFDATKQQGSNYHADMYTSEFPYMADGSFIMVSDQAALTLIRLGSAYRRNPSLFGGEMRQTIKGYADYLASLQGVVIESDPDGFRLNEGMQISNVFYPGPVPDGITTMDVYTPGNNPTIAQANVPVRSLCGTNDSTSAWTACIGNASYYYKCQIDEPCLNLTYVGPRGIITGHDGYNVSRGWYYEFGCFDDIHLDETAFTASYDPCQIFDPTANLNTTVEALLAFTEAIPAVYDLSAPAGQALYQRSVNTYSYVKNTYDLNFGQNDPNAPFWGAALFLLYDYSGEQHYLAEAVALGHNGNVYPHFSSANTEGNAYYWEEYARHREAIENFTTYNISGKDPGQYFSDTMYTEYKDQGDISMDRTGERVFQIYRSNSRFQNSRQMLSVAVLAMKADELSPEQASFIPTIADNQLAWLTGMNLVQDGVALNATLIPKSFIFGIGEDQPTQFHSRLLVRTGYRAASGGQVIGSRGTGYQFKEDATHYQGFDGMSTILDKRYGANGNEWRNESNIDPFDENQTFRYGQEYIPGWINGAYDTVPDEYGNDGDNDIIFNYRDDLHTYQFTESTNEIVATAIELFAHLDGRMNDKPRYGALQFNTTLENGTLNLRTTPGSTTVAVGDLLFSTNGAGKLVASIAPGTYALTVSKPGYEDDTRDINITSGGTTYVNVTLIDMPTDATLQLFTSPGEAIVGLNTSGLNTSYIGTTASDGTFTYNVTEGTYTLMVGKENFNPYLETDIVIAGTVTRHINLTPANGTLNITTQPAGALIMVDSRVTGNVVSLAPNVPHLINASLTGYATNTTLITLQPGEQRAITLTLPAIPTNITSSGTSLVDMSNLTPGAYYMFETETATFDVSLTSNGTIRWVVNGIPLRNATGLSDTFAWTPGAFFTSNIQPTTVTAVTPGGNVTWHVDVENVINPYFDGAFGADSTVVHVFTNDYAVNFTSLDVIITAGNVQTTYALDHTHSGHEVDWKLTISPAYGNNNITSVIGRTNDSNTTYTFVGTERVHFRNFPGSGGNPGGTGSERTSAGGGGGGGGAAPQDGGPELIYVTLGKDVLSPDESETVTLDAKTDSGNITRVQVSLDTPLGTTLKEDLSLTRGSNQYGTWEVSIGGLKLGKYVLTTVTIWTDKGFSQQFPVDGREFFVTDGSASEELGLVYSVLNQNVVENGTDVILRIDARDTEGVTTVFAEVTTDKGEAFTVPMHLIEGTAQYGTWEGVIKAGNPDTTYTIQAITLGRSAEQSKRYTIYDRSIYVEPEKQDLLTGNVVGGSLSIREILQRPLLPTLIGFGLMAVISVATFLFFRPKHG